MLRTGESLSAETGPVIGRYDSLDCLRGLAALGVVFTHASQRVLPFGILNHTPFRIFVNGRSFVIFFFVLSGFVLAKAIWGSHSKRNYWNYAAWRLVRLYGPYWVAGVIGLFVIGNADVLKAFASYCAVLGTWTAISINPPSWSLVFELRISLLMPFLCLLIAQRPLTALVMTGVLFLAAEALILALHIGQFPYSAENLLDAAVITARFLVCFSVGALLAYDTKHRDLVWTTLKAHRGTFLLLALALMSVLLDQASMIGSVIVISLAVSWERFAAYLVKPPFRWLGRISYSLYLTHFLILELAVSLLSDILSPARIMLIAIPSALLVAEIFYEFVERPTIAWSRRV